MSSATLDRRPPGPQASRPFEESRVGDLVRCVEVFSALTKLCEEHINIVEKQLDQDLQSLFSDTGTITSTTSPWSDFSMQDLQNRKSYLVKELLPWVSKHLNLLQKMRTAFAQQWRRDPSRRVNDHFKAVFEKFLTAGRGIEHCFHVPVLDGPFYIRLEAESRGWRGSIIRENLDLESVTSSYSPPSWHESDGTPLPLRANPVEHSVKKSDESLGQLLKGDTFVQRDMEKSILGEVVVNGTGWDIRTRLKRQARRRPVFVAAAVVFSTSLLISITWSLTAKDTQTGFTIGGFFLAAGGIAIAVLKRRRNTRKVALK